MEDRHIKERLITILDSYADCIIAGGDVTVDNDTIFLLSYLRFPCKDIDKFCKFLSDILIYGRDSGTDVGLVLTYDITSNIILVNICLTN